MKQLKCEMCGSTDLVKQDGMFICQTCGTKYSIEEAMIEGTVAIRGTVKVDNSDELSNLYQIARRAKDENNSENAAVYYDMILMKDPTSWEASFYVVYFKAMQTNIAGIQSAAVSITNCLDSVLDLIKDHVSPEKAQNDTVVEVAARCVLAAKALYNRADNGSSISSVQQLQDLINRRRATINILYFAGDKIETRFGTREALHAALLLLWKTGIQQHNNNTYHLNKEQTRTEIIQYVKKIQKYEPTYQPPKINMSTGGCYVATCVYGSYDCPEVWMLRRYRDNVLGSTRRGRAFIRCYYAVSPTLVKWFGHTKWFKKMWRGKLDKMVRELREQGVEDTPYEDIDWRQNGNHRRKDR